jgi:hypothetical protein
MLINQTIVRAGQSAALAGAMLLGVFDHAEGATISARSMSREDVGAAVSSARNGDTVVVPPGQADWTSPLIVTKAITLQFAGIGQSIILDDIALINGGHLAPAEAVISLEPANAKALTRITGLQINEGTNARPPYTFLHGTLQVSGNTCNARIDHCLFTNVNNDNIYVYGACPLIDHCTFYAKSANVHAICVWQDQWAGGAFGDGSWTAPAPLGTSNAVYVEDCNFTGPKPGTPYCLMDGFCGARYVFRYNNVTNSWITCHGTESTAFYRGTRSMEIYMNTLSNPEWYCGIEFRSATGVVWSNTASGYKFFCRLSNYRVGDAYQYWGAANGTNPLDKNADDGPFLTATHTGENHSQELIVANANWTVNQWRGYTAVDVNEPAATNFGMIYANTATTAYLMGPARHPHVVFDTGDTVKFYKVIYALDTPGMGQCGPLKRDREGNPLGPWPHQTIEPIYAWGNTLDGAQTGLDTSNPIIVEGIQFINDTPKPGYTPFTYPHPLTLR